MSKANALSMLLLFES